MVPASVLNKICSEKKTYLSPISAQIQLIFPFPLFRRRDANGLLLILIQTMRIDVCQRKVAFLRIKGLQLIIHSSKDERLLRKSRMNSRGSIRLRRGITHHRLAVNANGIDARDRSTSNSRTNGSVRLRGTNKIPGNVAGCTRTLDCWKYCGQEQIKRRKLETYEFQMQSVIS